LLVLVSAIVLATPTPSSKKPDMATIIQKSVQANDWDFKAAPRFNYKQRERTKGRVKTTQVTMIDGSPYERLIEVSGKQLDSKAAAAEEQKQQAEFQRRKDQDGAERKKRIEKYERDRTRDHVMMAQLSAAFSFTLLGERKVRGFKVWALKAMPKPGYKPPNMQAQVLPGMQGEMWIDQKTFEWVKVMAKVTRPVSIEGFLAQVQPGTEFEVEKSPVAHGVWQITHFSSIANAKVLHMISHNEQDDVTFFDFQPVQAQ
jgi:hypothetical protein